MAWVTGTDGNLFLLCRITAFKLTFEESRNKCHSVGSHWCPRTCITEQTLLQKYQIIFLGEEFFEFILAFAEETYCSILVEKIPPFSLEPETSAWFLDKFKSWTRTLQSRVNKWGSVRNNLRIQSSFSWTLPITYRFFKHCECGRSYPGETGRLWAMKLREHKQNLEVSHLARSRLAQHSCEKNHHILRKEAKILRPKRNKLTGSIRKWPAWHTKSYRPTQHWNFFRLVPLDQEWNILIIRLIPWRFVTSPQLMLVVVGFSVHVLWFCMRCLWSDQFEFVALFIVSVVLVCGVFQMLFFKSCGCF